MEGRSAYLKATFTLQVLDDSCHAAVTHQTAQLSLYVPRCIAAVAHGTQPHTPATDTYTLHRFHLSNLLGKK